MKLRRIGPWLLLGLLSLFLSSCGPVPDIWVERLEIEVHDDLSSRVRFIVVQSADSLWEDTREMGTSMLETSETEWVKPCGFKTRPYLAAGGDGYIATADFSGKGDLEHALSCVNILGLWAKFHALKVDEGPLGVDYEFRIDLAAEGLWLIRQVQVTLPGKMELLEPTLEPSGSGGVSVMSTLVKSTLVSQDTILWKISLPPAAPTEPTVADQATPVSTPTEPPPIILSLVARSHRSNIRVEWILSALGMLFGSGVIWRLLGARRKKAE